MRHARSLLLLAFLSSLALAQVNQSLGLVVTAPKQLAADEVEFGFVLTNSFPERAGELLLSFNPARLELRTGGATCEPGAPTKCRLPVDVAGSADVRVRVGLKGYFESENVDVVYVLPARGASAGSRLSFANTPEPGAIKPSELSLLGLLVLVVGAALWVLTLLRAIKGALKQHFLLLSVVANLVLAGGALLATLPALGPLAGLVAALVFAVSFLLLAYLHKAREVEPKTLTLEGIARERSRAQEAMNVAKVRFMRREIDERTFARLTGDIELELVKLEARERELRAEQQPPAQDG